MFLMFQVQFIAAFLWRTATVLGVFLPTRLCGDHLREHKVQTKWGPTHQNIGSGPKRAT